MSPIYTPHNANQSAVQSYTLVVTHGYDTFDNGCQVCVYIRDKGRDPIAVIYYLRKEMSPADLSKHWQVTQKQSDMKISTTGRKEVCILDFGLKCPIKLTHRLPWHLVSMRQ